MAILAAGLDPALIKDSHCGSDRRTSMVPGRGFLEPAVTPKRGSCRQTTWPSLRPAAEFAHDEHIGSVELRPALAVDAAKIEAGPPECLPVQPSRPSAPAPPGGCGRRRDGPLPQFTHANASPASPGSIVTSSSTAPFYLQGRVGRAGDCGRQQPSSVPPSRPPNFPSARPSGSPPPTGPAPCSGISRLSPTLRPGSCPPLAPAGAAPPPAPGGDSEKAPSPNPARRHSPPPGCAFT